MIIVNSPGRGAPPYSFLEHADWFGFTLADLVFPSFLFAVGNAMSLAAVPEAFPSRRIFLIKVIKRTAIIFLLGYLMYWFPFVQQDGEGNWMLIPWSTTRVMGVLQRIALCYLVASLMMAFLSVRNAIIVSCMLLLAYWLILYIGGDPGQELTMQGNAIRKLDIFLLGEGHIYKRDVIVFDPEGILSTIPAIVNVVSGYVTGRYIRRVGISFKSVTSLLVAGAALVITGMSWSLVFPLSKKLWTSSFALLTIGIDVVIIAILLYLIEIKNIRFGVAFFNIIGKNSLAIYLLSEIAFMILDMIQLSSGQSIFDWLSIEIFQTILPGSMGSLITGVCFMLMCWLVSWWLDRNKVYIKV